MNLRTLSTYLVKIKTQVDSQSTRATRDELDKIKSNLKGMFTSVTANTISAAATITSALMTINGLIAKTVLSVSEADVEAERFAQRMWTTEQNARSMLNALEAVDAEFDDIFYMTPEQWDRLMDLRGLSFSLEAPKEAQQTLVTVRDIVHQFDRLQVLMDYAKQWFVYFLGAKYGDKLNAIKENVTNFVDYLIDKMPGAMEALADFAAIIMQLGGAGLKGIVQLASALFSMLDRLPNRLKMVGLALGALGLMMLGSPLTWFIAGLTALLLLLDDFYVWQQGGKSLLGDTWEKMSKALDDDNSALGRTKQTLEDIYDLFISIWDAIDRVVDKVADFNEEFEILNKLAKNLEDIVTTGADAIGFGVDFLAALAGSFGIGDYRFHNLFDDIGNYWSNEENVNRAGRMFVPFYQEFNGPPMGNTYLPNEMALREAIGGPINSGNTTNTMNQTNNINVSGSWNDLVHQNPAQRIVDEIVRNRDNIDPFH